MTAILKVDTIQDTAGNNIINESSDTITIGASGDTIALAGTTVTGITQGITMADAWRTSATATFTGGGFITANWEQVDTDSGGTIGTAMSQSSGVFTFPATGIYLVQAQVIVVPDGLRTYTGGQIYVTVNNSDYDVACDAYQHTTTNTEQYCSVYMSFTLDVTNTSNVKVKLRFNSSGSADVVGHTSRTYTGMTFIRLGDT